MLHALLFLLAFDPATVSNWRELVQKPHEKLPLKDLGLKLLLETTDGKKASTPTEWEKQPERLRAAWLERLGPAPARPDRLDVKIESTEKVEGHQRQLLQFVTEGDDVLRTYLLIPN